MIQTQDQTENDIEMFTLKQQIDELSNEINKLEETLKNHTKNANNAKNKMHVFKKLIQRMKIKYGDDVNEWSTDDFVDASTVIKKYKKNDFLFYKKKKGSSLLKLIYLDDDDGDDGDDDVHLIGGKRRSKQRRSKQRRSKQRRSKQRRRTQIKSKNLSVRCCTRRSRRISCRRGETAFRR